MNVKDKIYLLYFETVTGSISPEDQLFVQQELEENAAFREIWLRLEKKGDDLKINDFAGGIDENAQLIDLKERLNIKHQDHKDFTVNKSSEYLTPSTGTLKENLISANETGGYANDVKAAFPRSKQKRFIWRWAAAVFILVCLSGVGYWLMGDVRITRVEEIASIVSKDKKKVELLLASGKKVAIAAGQVSRTIQINGGAVALNMDSLTFDAGDTAQNLLTVPDGRFYHITLGDGTKVTLNSSTSLRFPFRFKGTTREVYVDGEAYFSVSKDPSRPFIVHTPLTSIRVLGTKFNVNTYQKGSVKTALLEGSVSTEANNLTKPPVLLRPGNEASFEIQNGFKTHPFDKDDVLSWLDGIYYFHNITIEQLAKVISRNFGVLVKIENPSLGGRSVTGVMDRNNLPELLSDLSMTAGVRYYYKNDQLYLQ